MRLCLLSLVLLTLPLGSLSCTSLEIQDANTCAPAGKLSQGGLCTHLTNNKTSLLTFNELIDFIEAQPERTCVPVPGFPVCADDQSQGVPVKMPARGAAFILSASDFGQIALELQEGCRMLGKRCSFQMQLLVEKLNQAKTLLVKPAVLP